MDAMQIVYTPTEISQLSDKYLADRMEARKRGGVEAGVPLYISNVDAKTEGDTEDDGFLPGLPGEMLSLIARPGHGKTSFLMRWARKRSRELRKAAMLGDAAAEKRIVLYVTLEQSVEELSTFHLAAETQTSITKMALGKINDTQWDDILAANARRISDPLWFIGYSPSRRLKKPIDIEWLGRAMESIITQHDLVIDMVVLDYLQKLPYRGDKTEGISLNMDEYKRLLTQNGTFGCIGVQSKREVDQREDKTPYMDDGQWTSNIEQASDKVLSIVRPSVYCAQGGTFKSVQPC